MRASLQDGVNAAGSAVNLLWKPNGAPFLPPVVDREYVGWRQEQTAWHETVTISDLSFHMYDTFFKGSDATRLLEAVSANDYQSFAIGQAKQFVPVTSRGFIVTDGILMRTGPESYTLSGVPTAQSWVTYHAQAGSYDVSFESNADSRHRAETDPPRLFRYQIQGPLAPELVEAAFGSPLPTTKFLHSTEVTLAGCSLRALRHGMAGQAGYEFIGPWADHENVKQSLMEAGQPFGLVHVGALAYTTASVESGWISSPVPAIYTDPDLTSYREYLSLFGIEGQRSLHGSFYSPDIEDYYVSPWELGYGKSIAFNHDFIGRDALEQAREQVSRRKVTFVLNPNDVATALGDGYGFVLSCARYRVEADFHVAGMTYHAASVHPAGTVLALGLIAERYAEPGTEVEIAWGELAGPGADEDATLALPRIRATVARAPYDQYARTKYRSNS